MVIDVGLGNAGLAPGATGVAGRPAAAERLGVVVSGETRPTALPETPRPVRALDESAGRRAFEGRDPQRRDDDALAALLGGGRRDVEEPRGPSEREAQTLAARLRLDVARVAQSAGRDVAVSPAGAARREFEAGARAAVSAQDAEAQTRRSAGIEALQQRIDFAVRLSNPFEPARRELSIFV